MSNSVLFIVEVEMISHPDNCGTASLLYLIKFIFIICYKQQQIITIMDLVCIRQIWLSRLRGSLNLCFILLNIKNCVGPVLTLYRLITLSNLPAVQLLQDFIQYFSMYPGLITQCWWSAQTWQSLFLLTQFKSSLGKKGIECRLSCITLHLKSYFIIW